jgi:mRNA interferase RelE/StbE
MAYTIQYKKSARKAILKLPMGYKIAFIETFEKIAASESTRHGDLDISPMKGKNKGGFRLRIGDCRAIFTIENQALVLMVLKIRSRGDAYK